MHQGCKKVTFCFHIDFNRHRCIEDLIMGTLTTVIHHFLLPVMNQSIIFSQLSVHFFLPLLCHGPSIISQWDGQETGAIFGTLTAMSGALAKPFKHCLFVNGCLRAGMRRRGRVIEISGERKNTIV